MMVIDVRLSKDARSMIRAMTGAEKRECLAAAKKLYRNGLISAGRFQALSNALQK
jgi:hypothetical protein